MTDTAVVGAPTDTAKRPARSRPAAKPHGQWKVDGTTPLNANETWKQEDNGLNVRERIESVYAKEGFDSIDGTDLHGRFRWWGLYTQRKPGIDGGKTATLEPHELEDKYFMLRVRIDGGALTTEQLRIIGQISVDFARGSADLTDRQNIQPTGSAWRTSRKSGVAWSPLAFPRLRLAATFRASSWVPRWPESPKTRSSTPHR